MSFFDKAKYAIMRFMQGRYGVDRLGQIMSYTVLGLIVLNFFLHWGLISLLAWILLILMIFRMLSKNTSARNAENQKFAAFSSKFTASFRQNIQRVKNSKEYKYVRCPHCHSLLRVRRGSGEGTLTCGKCGEKIRVKA